MIEWERGTHPGTLELTFLSTDGNPRFSAVDKILRDMAEMLKEFGVDAAVSNGVVDVSNGDADDLKKDGLNCQGKRVCINTTIVDREKTLHHFTLFYDAELGRIGQPHWGQIGNLKEYLPKSLSYPRFKKALRDHLMGSCNAKECICVGDVRERIAIEFCS